MFVLNSHWPNNRGPLSVGKIIHYRYTELRPGFIVEIAKFLEYSMWPKSSPIVYGPWFGTFN